MQPNACKIAMIGECMIELNGQAFSTLQQTFGGDTLNTAIYTARALKSFLSIHAIDVAYITGLGQDLISEQMQKKWQDEGINTQFVARFADKYPGLYWIVLDDLGERSFMYWRDQSAAKIWLSHPNVEKTLTALKHYDWIYLSGISLAILSHSDRETLLEFLKCYKTQGGKIAFDSNYRKKLWQDNAIMQQTYKDILALTDLALLTNDDEKAIWNIDEAGILNNLKQFNLPTLILKQGAEGAQIIENGDIKNGRTIPSFKIKHVIDTTSAGDAFNAGVLASLMAGLDIDQACLNGHKIASCVIQHHGAIIDAAHMPLLS